MLLQTAQTWGQLTLTRAVRRAAGIQPGDLVLTRVAAPGTAEIRRLPQLRLADLLARYRIEGPIDPEADREQWQAEAAREVLGPTGG
jgi:bifunctional DNA-binding transcriptional regulator/antitoxin component of YhaV-PrlF toxin-antitoxin module